jgi:hypothetical protein
MIKSLKLKTGKFMVLESPVVKKGKRTYVDVTGNGRMYDTLGLARSAAADWNKEREPVIVMILETLRDGRVLGEDGWEEE